MKTCSEKDISQALESFRSTPRPAWQEKMRAELRNLEDDSNVATSSWSRFFTWNPLSRIFAPAFVLVLFAVGVFFAAPGSSPSAFEIHVQNARLALSEVENFAQTGVFPERSLSFFSQAIAAENDEGVIADLVTEVRLETAAALSEATIMSDLELKLRSFEEVVKLQEATLEIVSDALLRLENTAVIDEIAVALAITAEENAQVNSEREFIAHSDSEERLAINLKAPSPEGSNDRNANPEVAEQSFLMQSDSAVSSKKSVATGNGAELEFDAAAAVIADLEIQERSLAPNVQKKWRALRKIVSECQQEDEGRKCQSGKAKGLTVALQAKLRQEADYEMKRDERWERGERNEDFRREEERSDDGRGDDSRHDADDSEIHITENHELDYEREELERDEGRNNEVSDENDPNEIEGDMFFQGKLDLDF